MSEGERSSLPTIEWRDGVVQTIDQRWLPHRHEIVQLTTYQEVARAIREMWIRGAPAIGAAAAFGMALGALASQATTREALLEELAGVAESLRGTRPTAVNLQWATERMLRRAKDKGLADVESMKQALLREAQTIAQEDVAANRAIGEYGAELIEDGANILTHCNAGALATVDYGTALAPIRVAHRQGKRVHVWVDETRPRLQGARLTAWELMQEQIPCTLIVDGAAGYFMSKGLVDLVLVGADRVAANGDLANKIGTYALAVVARENGIPFYAAVPTSTIDLSIPNGGSIPIEEREGGEITQCGGCSIAPQGVQVANPAFDITPHSYLEGIITERGIVRPPFSATLAHLLASGGGAQ